jgi:hypothetical protein
LRSIGSDPDVSQSLATAGGGKVLGDIARCVVGHHGPGSDPLAGKPGERTLEKRHGGALAFVRQDLDIGEPRGIVNADVDVLPADTPSAISLVTGDPPSDASDLAEFLDIQVQELPRMVLAIALGGRWRRIQGSQLAQSMASQDTSDSGAWQAQPCGNLSADAPLSTQRQDLTCRCSRCLGRLISRA